MAAVSGCRNNLSVSVSVSVCEQLYMFITLSGHIIVCFHAWFDINEVHAYVFVCRTLYVRCMYVRLSMHMCVSFSVRDFLLNACIYAYLQTYMNVYTKYIKYLCIPA
jgi:hypothetical protein